MAGGSALRQKSREPAAAAAASAVVPACRWRRTWAAHNSTTGLPADACRIPDLPLNIAVRNLADAFTAFNEVSRGLHGMGGLAASPAVRHYPLKLPSLPLPCALPVSLPSHAVAGIPVGMAPIHPLRHTPPQPQRDCRFVEEQAAGIHGRQPRAAVPQLAGPGRWRWVRVLEAWF